MELCEWNPQANAPATEVREGNKVLERSGCPNEAILSVGLKENWHLCRSCAALPRFNRPLRRVELILAPGQDWAARQKAMKDVRDEILTIMKTYREQKASSYGVDTPGGLEHMGDVWRLLSRWDEKLRGV
jgi:hypothetical protein